jgi:hypothetical protein
VEALLNAFQMLQRHQAVVYLEVQTPAHPVLDTTSPMVVTTQVIQGMTGMHQVVHAIQQRRGHVMQQVLQPVRMLAVVLMLETAVVTAVEIVAVTAAVIAAVTAAGDS